MINFCWQPYEAAFPSQEIELGILPLMLDLIRSASLDALRVHVGRLFEMLAGQSSTDLRSHIPDC